MACCCAVSSVGRLGSPILGVIVLTVALLRLHGAFDPRGDLRSRGEMVATRPLSLAPGLR
jgi:hypothetical protein